jgi:hypothetical protein
LTSLRVAGTLRAPIHPPQEAAMQTIIDLALVSACAC